MPEKNPANYLELILGLDSHRFFLCDAARVVRGIFPQGDFLGFSEDELIGRDLGEFLGKKPLELSGAEHGQLNVAEALDKFGARHGLGFISVDPEAGLPVRGGPRYPLTLLVLETVKIKGLLDRQRRLESVQDRMREERQEELEAANRLLRDKAEELRKSLELIEYRNKQMVDELNLASELQKSLLPKEFPADSDFEFSHKYIPLSGVGGDFFDVMQIDAEHIGIVIIDVSGHGVAPAFITAMFKSSFHHFAPGELSPAKVLSALNQEFLSTLRSEHYLTAFYAILDTRDLSCAFCSAGHPKQLLARADGRFEELGTMGFFIGMFENSMYEDGRVTLGAGDCLFFFTDGIIETHTAEGEAFGREGIVRTCAAHRDESLDSMTNELIAAVLQFSGTPELEDDITFVAARVIEAL
jgi:serine phosphatase RsbU (regulator of sigma subunit)